MIDRFTYTTYTHRPSNHKTDWTEIYITQHTHIQIKVKTPYTQSTLLLLLLISNIYISYIYYFNQDVNDFEYYFDWVEIFCVYLFCLLPHEEENIWDQRVYIQQDNFFVYFFSFFFINFFYFGNEKSLLAKFSKRRNFTDAVREVKSVSLTYFHSSFTSPSSAALKFSFTFSHLISPDYIKA